MPAPRLLRAGPRVPSFASPTAGRPTHFVFMSLLEVSHLKKSFNGRAAVDDLSFSVDAGEIFGLLGPNGAGKSTAMMVMAGLLPGDAGVVRVEGQSWNGGHSEQKLILGLVPQELAVYPDLTGRENLEFFAGIYGIRGSR